MKPRWHREIEALREVMVHTVIVSGDAMRARSALIYGLVDPLEPLRIRYVGQTIAPAARMREHLTEGFGKKADWVQSLLEAGRAPDMVQLTWVTSTEALQAERHFIVALRRLRQADLNRNKRSRRKAR